MSATWTKGKNGDWLVRAEPGLTGQTVQVQKKSGGQSTVTLGRQIWQDPKSGVALYTAAPSGKAWSEEKFNGYGARRGGFVRKCRTGGNCSSFGSGRSCGADDCDGF